METQLRSWRLNGILKMEMAAGNSIARESYGGAISFVVLERAYMTPIRPNDGVVEYREQTFDKSVFKMVYFDTQTNEYLGCRAYIKSSPIKALKNFALNSKKK